MSSSSISFCVDSQSAYERAKNRIKRSRIGDCGEWRALQSWSADARLMSACNSCRSTTFKFIVLEIVPFDDGQWVKPLTESGTDCDSPRQVMIDGDFPINCFVIMLDVIYILLIWYCACEV